MLVTWAERGSGDAGAQRRLAELYYCGDGVRRDETEAARFYQKAVDQGGAVAQCDLAYMMRRGYLNKDDEAAAQLFRRPADQGGFPQAQSNLGASGGHHRDHTWRARRAALPSEDTGAEWQERRHRVIGCATGLVASENRWRFQTVQTSLGNPFGFGGFVVGF